jgi:hypothetical protein
MSENLDNDLQVSPAEELAALKQRADMIGVSYHPNIGLEKLREKVNGALADKTEDEAEAKPAAAAATDAGAETEGQKRARLKREASRLVRIRVTCMNPAKAEWQGEIFSVGNSVVGSFTKFVPFNADEGWHVPEIIYKAMAERQCQVFYTVPDSRGNKVRRGKLIKEFAIEKLDPLTKEELQELAQRQAMSKSVD